MQSVLFADTRSFKITQPGKGAVKAEMPTLVGKRVIIVEDEGITQIQLRQILTRAGLMVLGSATSGPEGVEMVARETPDLVLMDIRMPGEYDGLEAARRILAEQTVCIVMLTAFNDDDYKAQARQIGACGYVVKPIDRDTLLPQLESAYKQWKQP